LKPKTKCLFAARDPGAANVLVPVIKRLQGQAQFAVVALPKAGEVFRSAGIETQVLDASPSLKTTAEILHMHQPVAVVTGTSHYESFDSVFWHLAKKSGIAACAIIDGWHNMAARFRDGWPDKVFAIDEEQKTELVGLGARQEAIECVGQIWLSELRRAEKRKTDQHEKCTSILFVSEPIREDVSSGANRAYGFDQFAVFELLKKAAMQAAVQTHPVTIIVRLHPYEDCALWSGLVHSENNSGVNIVFAPDDSSSAACLEECDLVTGISSIVLLQAIAAGKPVLSMQPNLQRENTLVAASRGFVETILTDDEVAIHRIARIISQDEERQNTYELNRRFIESLPPVGPDPVIRWINAFSE
jgi:hypothetical protein